MDILVLSIVAGLVVTGGIWMVTRETNLRTSIWTTIAAPESTFQKRKSVRVSTAVNTSRQTPG